MPRMQMQLHLVQVRKVKLLNSSYPHLFISYASYAHLTLDRLTIDQAYKLPLLCQALAFLSDSDISSSL